MSTLVRNPTLPFSYSRRFRYEALGLHGRDSLLKSISYRRRRAKQRQIFLTTYKLRIDPQHSKSSSPSPKLKKVAVKVKKIVTSVFMFMRTASFSSCNSKSAISAASSPSTTNTF